MAETVSDVLGAMQKAIEDYHDKKSSLRLLRSTSLGDYPIRTDEDLFFEEFFPKIVGCYKKLQKLKK